ncbi:MAG: DUF5916 domain-containing protein [bacterium]
MALLGFFLASGISFAYAQNYYVLSRIGGTVTLNGLSDEPAWEGIEPLPVVMHMPNFGGEPSERTEIFIAYDDDYLYVAGRLFDSQPSGIQAPSKKRDDLKLSNDWFGIIIDSFNDKENALGFFTTPSGLRLDLTVYNDAQGDFPVNVSWNTFWDVAAVRTIDGWFAEMRIPFSSLRFQDREGRVVISLIAWRWIARKNESAIFPAIPPKWGWWSQIKPSQAQEVMLDGVHSRKPLYITPYLLGGSGQSFELNNAETAYRRIDDPARDVGLDIKYGFTSNITLDITVNTDFAQVEADDQQINLTRFSLFFPEKRLFFQERSSTFDFNFGGFNRLFYSRRIGIHEGKSVPIYGGARLVGRVGTWDLGFLNMQTAPIEDLSSENFSVLRLRRRVFNPFSYVGGIVTSRMSTDGTYNTAYGLDGIFRLFRDDYLMLNWAQSFENGREWNIVSLEPVRMRVNWERRTIKGISYNLSYSQSGDDYNPGIGFEMRDNYTRFGNSVLYGWIPGKESSLLRHQISVNGFLFLRNTDRSIESAIIGPGWEFTTKSGYSGEIAANIDYEDLREPFSLSDNIEVPAGQYTFYGLNGEFSTPMGKLFFTRAKFDAGFFYDGWRVTLGMFPQWNISSELELSSMYEFNRVTFPDRDQRFTAHIGRLRALVMLSTRFSVTAFIQYNSAIDVVITNIRFRYNPREGNDLYLVYDEGMNTDRYREEPALPFTSSRTVMLKYTYTFNL